MGLLSAHQIHSWGVTVRIRRISTVVAAVAAVLILEASPASAASISWSSCSGGQCDYGAVANNANGTSTATVLDGSADGLGAGLQIQFYNTDKSSYLVTLRGKGSTASQSYPSTIRRARICDYLDYGPGYHNCGGWKNF
ncbi:hypothetical protein GCM10010507_21450 [Streptomyces cinnamoneus]|uniref:Uncharacterized protein n=1 Tax=Streptomyces cinnamoneus TaxID=53446 RepID=A0A918TEN1_STRCJ|nr:hypothetical protein GCM10010507_21450 [Streptomyces cinnamoneus]